MQEEESFVHNVLTIALKNGKISAFKFLFFLPVVSRQKGLITVFAVANAQKQGVMRVRLVLTSSTTMFQEEGWIARKTPHTARGILPGEEIVRAFSTPSVITANNAPSGKLLRQPN